MKGRYEIRIYNERFNMSPDYYGGDEDIKLSIWCKTSDDLKEKWEKLLEENEGETYSVWDHLAIEIITGGAYDPNDWEIIDEYLKDDYVYVDIYADSTCLFTDEFCDCVSNVITVRVKREIVFEFFKKFIEEDFKTEDDINSNWSDEKLFYEWFEKYYTCDDFEPEGFYSWCVDKGADIRIHTIK